MLEFCWNVRRGCWQLDGNSGKRVSVWTRFVRELRLTVCCTRRKRGTRRSCRMCEARDESAYIAAKMAAGGVRTGGEGVIGEVKVNGDGVVLPLIEMKRPPNLKMDT
nr:unnamed protein product [Callosobruchus analis]